LADLILHKKNEAYIQVECDKSIAQELSDFFCFFVPGYQFVPAYKNKLWDGRIRLFDLRTFTIYHGLVHYIIKFCKERNYTYEVDDAISTTENFSLIEAVDFIKTLGLPFEPRDYQIKSFVNAVRNKRMLLLSPTASGKSLIIYLIIRWLQEFGYERGLLIVPTTSLCYQMFKDFESYSISDDTFIVDDEISIIMAGKDKNPKVERIKVTMEDGKTIHYKPNEKVKTKKGYILAKNLTNDDEII
jgi:hypothetical protein